MKTNKPMMLACVAVLIVGCGREASSPTPIDAPATAPASPRGPVALTDAPPAATVIPNGGDTSATLQRLTQALRDHVVRSRSVPKDFEEFVAKSQVSFPPPPEGQKYVIRGQEVVLVKR